MAKNKIERRLTTTISFVVAIVSLFMMNMTNVFAKVLVDNGSIKDSSNSKGGVTKEGVVNISDVANNIFNNMRIYLNGFSGIALITLTLAFVIRCAQLAASADNANKREMHITGMLWTIIAVAGLGAFSLVMSIIAGFAKGI